MKAVIETGGKQYRVSEGSEIYVEKINGNAGDKVTFDKVVMADGRLGIPYLTDVKVEGEIVKQGKQRKIKIFKYRPKKSSHKTIGHRQPYTKIIIKTIK